MEQNYGYHTNFNPEILLNKILIEFKDYNPIVYKGVINIMNFHYCYCTLAYIQIC